MRHERGASPAALLQTSLRLLSSHRPQKAIAPLQKAVALCTLEDRAQLERALYWLSIALMRVGRTNLAIKALANARRVVPRGHSAALYKRLTNDYGMPRSACCDHDDYRAFFSIQVRRYLGTVPGAKFTDRLEMDTVLEMIAASWLRFKRAHDLSQFRSCEKVGLYEQFRIQFPRLRLSGYSKCAIVSFSGYAVSREFSLHDRVFMPWEAGTV